MSSSTEDLVITPEQYDKIAEIQYQILEKLAYNESIDVILNSLCHLAEQLLPNAVASIMLIDDQSGLMSVLSAPSIPQAGIDALTNLKPGPCGGSCGNAIFNNEAQYVLNTFEDNRWACLRQVAYDFNICSCWSTPIRNANDKAIGSFALSSFEHRIPSLFHKKILEIGATIISIVLKKKYKEQRILLLSTAIKSASEGVIITDKFNKIVEVNPAFRRIYDYAESDIVGKSPKLFNSGKHNKVFYQKMWQKISTKGKWQGEIINKRKDGSYVTQWMSITVIRNELNQVQNYVSIFSDITELKIVQQQIIENAFTDPVTHLRNKAFLEQQLLNSNNNHSLLLLNINNFSYINAAYGFAMGDKILKATALTLEHNFECHQAFRLNSDELALLYIGKIDIPVVIKKIQKFNYTTLIEVDDISLHITFTYGAAFGKKNILKNAALALKNAKDIGKNRYYIYDNQAECAMQESHSHFIESNNRLHSAIEQSRILPYFQGVYDNKLGQITKFEVLARIKEKDEILSPFYFIETAKLAGLIPEVTRIIIDKSFNIMARYSYDFSINITEDDLSQNYLVSYLKLKCSQYKISPSRVILEILEGVSASGKKSHSIQLRQLKENGFSLAIDDFGTEYSNFERILDLEIDYIKIDAKYIKDIDSNTKSYEISRAIAFFASNSKIPCIAEFVHNSRVQKVVNELGIDYSQGYYFSEPTALPFDKGL